MLDAGLRMASSQLPARLLVVRERNVFVRDIALTARSPGLHNLIAEIHDGPFALFG